MDIAMANMLFFIAILLGVLALVGVFFGHLWLIFVTIGCIVVVVISLLQLNQAGIPPNLAWAFKYGAWYFFKTG
jgi:hypothetical protein